LCFDIDSKKYMMLLIFSRCWLGHQRRWRRGKTEVDQSSSRIAKHTRW